MGLAAFNRARERQAADIAELNRIHIGGAEADEVTESPPIDEAQVEVKPKRKRRTVVDAPVEVEESASSDTPAESEVPVVPTADAEAEVI